uniref:Uncharacterized protein n=1 Tax=Sphaerodactylus townsendi TaxID=933632 RepID=A0ACB8FF99_9SAUR
MGADRPTDRVLPQICPSAMARPLQDGSRTEPTAAVPGSPGFPLGGTVAVPPPVCRSPLGRPPRLNCSLCPGAPHPHALHLCMRGQQPPRSRTGEAHGSLVDLGSSPRQELPTEQPPQLATQPNGYLPRSTVPSLEQALGARLRHMGDQFHREHQRGRQQRRQQRHPAWEPLYHFIFQLLGIFYNLPVEQGVGLGPN